MTSLPPSLHTVHHTVSFPSIPTSIPPPPHFSIPPRLNLLHATSSSSIPSSPASHPFTPIPVISPMGELCPIQQNSLTAVEGHSTPQLVVPTQSVGALHYHLQWCLHWKQREMLYHLLLRFHPFLLHLLLLSLLVSPTTTSSVSTPTQAEPHLPSLNPWTNYIMKPRIYRPSTPGVYLMFFSLHLENP